MMAGVKYIALVCMCVVAMMCSSVTGIDIAVNSRWLTVHVESREKRIVTYTKATDDIEMIVVRWRHDGDRSFPSVVVTSEAKGVNRTVFNISDVTELIDDPNILVPMMLNDATYTIELGQWTGAIETMIRRDASRLMLENVESLLLTQPNTYTLGLPHESTAGVKIDLCGEIAGQLILTKYLPGQDKVETSITAQYINFDPKEELLEARLSYVKKDPGLTMFKVTRYTEDELKLLKNMSTTEIISAAQNKYTIRFNASTENQHLDAVLVGGNDYQSVDFRRKCGFDPAVLEYAMAETEQKKADILVNSVWNYFKQHGQSKLKSIDQYSTKSISLRTIKFRNYRIANGYFTDLEDNSQEDNNGIFVGATMERMRYFYVKVLDSTNSTKQPIIDSTKVIDRWQYEEGIGKLMRYLSDESLLNSLLVLTIAGFMVLAFCLVVRKLCGKGDDTRVDPTNRQTEIETIDHNHSSDEEDN